MSTASFKVLVQDLMGTVKTGLGQREGAELYYLVEARVC